MGCASSRARTLDEIAVDNMAKRPSSEYVFKLILVGDYGVGKTSLLGRFTEGTFPRRIYGRGVQFEIKTIKLDGDKVKLQLFDTAGTEWYRSLPACFYRGAAGAIAVYDVTNQQSFSNVKRWLDDFDRFAREDAAILLVGNKCDLTTDKVVDYTTAKEYADKLGIAFIETSAKDYINVDQAFITLAAEVKNIIDSQADNSLSV